MKMGLGYDGGKQQRERGNTAGPLFWKKKCFEVGFEGAQKSFLLERKGKVIP